MFRFILFIILTININIQASAKVICELEGTYSITYEDVTKNFLAEGIDLFRNLAVQTQ